MYDRGDEIIRVKKCSRSQSINTNVSRIVPKMVPVKLKPKGTGLDRNADEKPSIARAIILALPSRLKKEKAANISGIYHFDISGPNGGKYSVMLDAGNCEILEGFHGEAKCLTEVEDTVYEGIELGKSNPQEALMTGKLKVSNIMEMMTFGGLFKKL